MNKIRCILLLFFCHIASQAQTTKSIAFEGRNIQDKQIFFAAEIHSIMERWAFYESLCTYLVANNGIRNVVLECGHSEAWLQNEYLRNGDTTYFRYYPYETDIRHFIDHLRLINDNLPDEKKLSIRGMDFERMDFIIAARQILHRNARASHTMFYNYTFGMHDSMLQKVHMTSQQHWMRRKEYSKAHDMFTTSKDTLKHELEPEDFASLELIFENPNTEKKWARRDKGMYKNVVNQHLLNQPFLCIVGRYHIEYRRGEIHYSFMKKLVRNNKGTSKKIAIIDEVRNGAFREQHLFRPENFQAPMAYGTAGPQYFIKSDTAMSLAYSKYFQPQLQYTLVYKDVFSALVKKDNHHLDSWYVFFGEPPAKKPSGITAQGTTN